MKEGSHATHLHLGGNYYKWYIRLYRHRYRNISKDNSIVDGYETIDTNGTKTKKSWHTLKNLQNM
jgi:hypothetical protein